MKKVSRKFTLQRKKKIAEKSQVATDDWTQKRIGFRYRFENWLHFLGVKVFWLDFYEVFVLLQNQKQKL